MAQRTCWSGRKDKAAAFSSYMFRSTVPCNSDLSILVFFTQTRIGLCIAQLSSPNLLQSHHYSSHFESPLDNLSQPQVTLFPSLITNMPLSIGVQNMILFRVKEWNQEVLFCFRWKRLTGKIKKKKVIRDKENWSHRARNRKKSPICYLWAFENKHMKASNCNSVFLP